MMKILPEKISSYCLNADCVKYFSWKIPLSLVICVVDGAILFAIQDKALNMSLAMSKYLVLHADMYMKYKHLIS
jgi:hypothetical protein